MFTDLEILQEILNNNTSYTAYRKCIKETLPDIHTLLTESDLKYAEAIYWLLHGLSETPCCAECNIPLKYIDRTEGYRTFCSTKCASKNSNTKAKRKKTIAETYNGDMSLSVEKRKKTMLKRHGVEHALQNKEISDKAKKTCSQNDQTKITEKRKDTIRERYGVDNLWHHKPFVDKVKLGNIKKHGAEWPQQNTTISEKGILTRKKSFYNKLSVRCPTVVPLFDEFISVNHKHQWQCLVCDNVFLDNIDDGSQPICDVCYPRQANSLGEKEVIHFIKSLGINDIVINDRTIISPKELDIYIPELNLAIEYCGLYWHSEKKVTKDYHKIKLDLCNKLGIRLITIFEDEWLSKRLICENRLRYALRKTPLTCYARQTCVQEVPFAEAKAFTEKHHIQGYTPAAVRLGLYFKNNLVSIMTIGKTRRIMNTSGIEYEILRFCSDGNVPGASQKLFKYFTLNYKPNSIVSYCDLRWGTGGVYEQLGFVYKKTTSPGYWYTKDGLSRLHRYNFAKNKLVKNGYDENLTEREITEKMGYYRVWDCGNLKFIWQKL